METAGQRYQIQGPLGSGGQGHTFRALDLESGSVVALKRIQLRDAGSWKPFDLFERECSVLRSLRHPGIPRFLDTFSEPDQGRYYLVMELVEGAPLVRRIRDGLPTSLEQIWSYLHQALDILGYLHGLTPPVIHRDIKPSNLVLRQDGRLFLVDFGGVRVALRPEGGSTMVGTFGYMAPEQLHGEAAPATDIYGLGATLAALACGREADRLPHRGLRVDLEEVMAASPLRGLLSRMLEPDPLQRPGSVAAVREEIEEIHGARRAHAGGPASAGPRAAAGQEAGGGHGPECVPVPPADEEAEDPRLSGPLAGLPGPLLLVLRVIGSLGYVGLVLVDAVLLPLVFALISSGEHGPVKRRKLQAHRDRVREALRSGKRAMRSLSRGRDPYPPGLPPGPDDRGASPGRSLPPGRRPGDRPGPGRGPGPHGRRRSRE